MSGYWRRERVFGHGENSWTPPDSRHLNQWRHCLKGLCRILITSRAITCLSFLDSLSFACKWKVNIYMYGKFPCWKFSFIRLEIDHLELETHQNRRRKSATDSFGNGNRLKLWLQLLHYILNSLVKLISNWTNYLYFLKGYCTVFQHVMKSLRVTGIVFS